MKIIDIVKLNDGYAFVLDESPTMVYHEEMVKDKYMGRMKKMLVGQNEAGMMDIDETEGIKDKLERAKRCLNEINDQFERVKCSNDYVEDVLKEYYEND